MTTERNATVELPRNKGNSVKLDASINGAKEQGNSSGVTSGDESRSRSSCSGTSESFHPGEPKAPSLSQTTQEVSTGVNASPSPVETQHTKRIEWSDLTVDRQALLKDYLKNGIHVTPEQILKIASGDIEYRPPPSSLDDEIAAIHVDIETGGGQRRPVLEGRRIEVGLGRKTKANPDFVPFWKKKDMSAAVSLRKGYISLSAHGGVHYVKQELASYDLGAPRSVHRSLLCWKRPSAEGNEVHEEDQGEGGSHV